jgi:hypothetical protein
MFNTGPNATTIVTGIAAYMCPGRGRPTYVTGGASNALNGPWSDYAFNAQINCGALAATYNLQDNKRTMVSITDGTSNTIFAGHGTIGQDKYATNTVLAGFSGAIFTGGLQDTGHAGSAAPVASTGMAVAFFARDPASGATAGGWGGPFSQGGLMGMGDGTVRLFPYSMGVAATSTGLGAFLTPNNGEATTLPDT